MPSRKPPMSPEEQINRPFEEGANTQALLLDLYRTVGNVETQNVHIIAELQRASEGRSKLYQSQAEIVRANDAIVRRLDVIDDPKSGVVAKLDEMKPHIASVVGLRKQLALATLAFAALITGAGHIVWYAVTHVGDMRRAISSLFGSA